MESQLTILFYMISQGSLVVMDQLGNLSVINNVEDITVVFVEWKQGTIPIFYVLGKYFQCLLMIVKICSNRRFFGGKVSQELKKKELEEELEARSVEITDETKPNLVEHLNDILHGICRPPALMLKSPIKSSKELYIDDYKIMGCEPLHDIT